MRSILTSGTCVCAVTRLSRYLVRQPPAGLRGLKGGVAGEVWLAHILRCLAILGLLPSLPASFSLCATGARIGSGAELVGMVGLVRADSVMHANASSGARREKIGPPPLRPPRYQIRASSAIYLHTVKLMRLVGQILNLQRK